MRGTIISIILFILSLVNQIRYYLKQTLTHLVCTLGAVFWIVKRIGLTTRVEVFDSKKKCSSMDT